MKTKGKGGWTVQEIKALAIQCGIDVTGKTRDQLCAEIAMAAAARSGSSGSDVPPTPRKPSRIPDIPPYKPSKPPVKPPTKPGRGLTGEVLNNLVEKGDEKHVCVTKKIAEFYKDLYDPEDPTDEQSDYFKCIKSLYELLLPVLDKKTLVTKRDLPSDDELSGYNGGWYSGPMDREILWKEIVKPCLAQTPVMPPKPPVMPPKPPARPPAKPPTGKSARVNPEVLAAINEFLDNNLPLNTSPQEKQKNVDVIIDVLAGVADDIADSDLETYDLPRDKRLQKLGLNASITREALFDELYDESIKGLNVFSSGGDMPSPESEDDECGGRFDSYMRMSPLKLRNALKGEGVSNPPVGRGAQVDYLCAMQKNGRCSPEDGQDCGEGFVCDTSATPGVCLTEEQADARRLDEYIMPNGRKVIGTPEALAALRARLEATVPTPTPTPDTPPSPTPPAVDPTPTPTPDPTPAPDPTPPPSPGTEARLDILRVLEEQARKGQITDEQLARYTAALDANGQCDPDKGVMCNGELVCDLTNKVCVDSDLAAERTTLRRMEIGGKTYIGSPLAIKMLQQKLAPKPPASSSGDTPIKPIKPKKQPMVRPGPKPPKVPAPVVPKGTPDKPPEGTVVPDIEDILRRLEAGDTGDIADLAECQREVLKCLALHRGANLRSSQRYRYPGTHINRMTLLLHTGYTYCVGLLRSLGLFA
jgi:hypothetical protein